MRVKYTYVDGFRLIITRDVTKGDVIKFCTRVNQLYEEEFGRNPKITPEKICEGGFVFGDVPKCWDHRDRKPYKSMRLGCNRESNRDKWPFVDDDVMNAWKDDTTVIFKGGKGKSHFTFLKAFYGAPVWKLDELNVFLEAFAEIGMVLHKKLPSTSDLCMFQEHEK